MNFLNPTYLWALLGLVIPVAIHLWSNKEGKTIKIGSVQFLEKSDVKQTNSIKLNELFLLFLRLLIITILVFILAEPHIKKEETTVPITYLIESSLLKNASLSSLVDSLQQNSSIKLLQTSFPDLDAYNEDEVSNSIPNYWQLAREVEDLPTDSIVVFTNAYFQGFKGKRPKLSRDISWIVVEDEVQVYEILEVVQKGDEVEVLELISEQQKLSFKKQKLPLNSDVFDLNNNKDSLHFIANSNQNWIPLKVEDSIRVLIYYGEKLEATKSYLESSFKAISKYLDRPIQIVLVQDTIGIQYKSYHTLVWLSETPSYSSSQRLLVYNPDSLANSLIEMSSSKNTFHLTSTLTAENILSENLPEQLLKNLDLNKELKNKIQNFDRRTLNSNELTTKFVEAGLNKNTPNFLSISEWLWLVLFFLIISERIFARYRKQ